MGGGIVGVGVGVGGVVGVGDGVGETVGVGVGEGTGSKAPIVGFIPLGFPIKSTVGGSASTPATVSIWCFCTRINDRRIRWGVIIAVKMVKKRVGKNIWVN